MGWGWGEDGARFSLSLFLLTDQFARNVTFNHKHTQTHTHKCTHSGFPGVSVVKNPPANAGDTSSTPGSGRSPGGGDGQPSPVFCESQAVLFGSQTAVDRGA